jgi:hypothetical protein
VKSVNEVYRAQDRPLYSETISGLCALVRETTAKRKTDLCNPSEKLRGAPIENLPVVWNIRASIWANCFSTWTRLLGAPAYSSELLGNTILTANTTGQSGRQNSRPAAGDGLSGRREIY